MGAFFCSRELIICPPDHHLAAVIEEVLQELLEREDLRLVVEHPEEDDAEGGPHLGHLVEIVLNDLGHCVSFELDDDADPFAVGFVAEVGNALEALVLDEGRNLFDEPGLVDLVRQLIDDDRRPLALFGLADTGPRLHANDAAPGCVGVVDPLASEYVTRSRKVRARHEVHQILPPTVRDR